MSHSKPAKPSDPALSSSYSSMAVGENDLEAIGAQCEYAPCRQLDFLPFLCHSCKKKYCLEHRTEDGHACSKKGAWASSKRAGEDNKSSSSPTSRPTILTHDKQCSSPACKVLIDTALTPGIHCSTCRRDYCLKHRLSEDHDCARLARAYKRDENTGGSGSVGGALGKLKAWGAQKRAAAAAASSSGTKQTSSMSSSSGKIKSSPAPMATATAPLSRTSTATSATDPSSPQMSKLHRIISPFSSRKPTRSTASAQMTHLNALKRTAKGDSKLAINLRLYVHLEAVSSGEGQSGAKVPRADAFYSREWTVGRVLDAAAKTLQVPNVNNRVESEEQRLRVFSVEKGRLLGFGEKMGGEGVVRDGDTLVLLRGVGAPDAPGAS